MRVKVGGMCFEVDLEELGLVPGEAQTKLVKEAEGMAQSVAVQIAAKAREHATRVLANSAPARCSGRGRVFLPADVRKRVERFLIMQVAVELENIARTLQEVQDG